MHNILKNNKAIQRTRLDCVSWANHNLNRLLDKADSIIIEKSFFWIYWIRAGDLLGELYLFYSQQQAPSAKLANNRLQWTDMVRVGACFSERLY